MNPGLEALKRGVRDGKQQAIPSIETRGKLSLSGEESGASEPDAAI